MRIRASVFLYIPLVAVLVTGCKEDTAATNDASRATADLSKMEPIKGGKSAKTPRKKKEPTSFLGPTGVAP